MAMTLTGFVYDNAGNAISGATVQGYVSADNATTTAESSTTTDSNGKWSITTSTAARIPMDVKITYGSNVRWIKAGDKVNITDMTVTGTLTVGEDAAGFDFSLFSSDTSGDGLTWDASEEVLQITGKDANTALDVLDGDVRIVDKLYFYDRGGEYLSSDGSTLTITGATTVSGGLTSTAASNTFGATSFNDASITNVNDIALDSISADGTDINVAVSDNSATSFTVKQGSDAYLIIDTANSSESVSIGTGISGTAITLGHSTSEVTVADNLTVTGDLTVSGTTTTVDTTNTVIKDALIKLAQGTTASPAVDLGLIFTRGNGSASNIANRAILWDESDDQFAFAFTNDEDGTTSGNVDIDDYADIKVGNVIVEDEVQTANIGYTDGDNSMTIADGGKVTFAAGFDVGSDASGDVLYHNGTSYVRLARGSDDQVLTLASGVPSWATPTTGDITGITTGDGLSGGATSGTPTLAVDLVSNGGLEFSSGELRVATGISQYDVAQFGTGVVDTDFLQIDGTTVVGKSASEVAAAIEGSIDAVGTLAAGAISSGFGNIDIGSSTFDTTGAVSTGNLSPAGDVAVADAKVVKLGGTRPADDEPASNNTGYGVVVLFDAGAAVAIGDAVSIGTDGRVIKTVADATGTLSGPCIGVATTAAASADDDVYVMTHGVFRHDDWNFGTKGQAVYIEEADPGDLSLTAPNDDGDYAQRVGVAITDDVLLVMPSIDVIEHAG